MMQPTVFLVFLSALSAAHGLSLSLDLESLCKTTFGRNQLGSQCDPFLSQCKASSWSQWAQSPTNVVNDKTCSSRVRGVDERRRYVITTGANCPALKENRTAECLGSITADAVNAIRLFAALGSDISPAAAVVQGKTTSTTVKQIAAEAEKLLSPVGIFNPPPPPSCSCPCDSFLPQITRDLVVVVDSSGSVAESSFDAAVDALVLLLTNQCHFSGTCIRRDITRLALVDFSSTVKVIVDFETFARDYKDVDEIEPLIRSLPYFGQATATGLALQTVKDQILTEAAGMRPFSKKTILVLTDGKSNRGVDPGIVSNQIVTMFPGIEIIGLGIGSNVDLQELQAITHHNNAQANILLAGFENFTNIVDVIIALAGQCKLIAEDIYDKRK
eukprot:m.24837 g.24837  ORF g.24837 m.24837 type:complete len:387 (+) comp28686_c0_seq1:68-1228(+)